MPRWRLRSGRLACAMAIVVATATAAAVGVAAGVGEAEAEFDYRKLSGIIIPGFASTQLRAWSVLDCPYSPFDFNPLDAVWLDSTKADAWLRDAVAAEEARSKSMSRQFYISLTDDIQRCDTRVVDKVDAHEKKEEWLKLNHLRKMLGHLSERGVGRYVPGLLTNLDKIVSVLNSEFGVRTYFVCLDLSYGWLTLYDCTCRYNGWSDFGVYPHRA